MATVHPHSWTIVSNWHDHGLCCDSQCFRGASPCCSGQLLDYACTRFQFLLYTFQILAKRQTPIKNHSKILGIFAVFYLLSIHFQFHFSIRLSVIQMEDARNGFVDIRFQTPLCEINRQFSKVRTNCFFDTIEGLRLGCQSDVISVNKTSRSETFWQIACVKTVQKAGCNFLEVGRRLKSFSGWFHR